MYVSHFWDEGEAGQLTSVHWSRNISMPDMSDYVITSANISVVINATVKANWGYRDNNGGVEAWGDYTDIGTSIPFSDYPPSQNQSQTQFSTYDYVRFYSLISDIPQNKTYEIAQYQTGQDTYRLGHDTYTNDAEYETETYDSLNDTYLFSVPEESLKFFLSDVLSTDNHNFTFTMGMKIWCEDNFLNDDDSWDDLLIKSYNLTFTYEKVIDRDTSATWSQVGNSITEENAQITNGIVNFEYNISETPWVTASPNSEFRIKINGNQHNETVKISTATNEFQNASLIGFNVTNLLQKNVNISLAIELYLADEFTLADNITISITNVHLLVAYVLIEPGPPPPEESWPYLVGLMAGGVALLAGFGLYEGIFKFPVEVRNIRSLKRKIRKGRSTKPLHKKDASTIGNELQAKEQSQLKKKLKSPSTKNPSKHPEKTTKSYVEAEKIKDPNVGKENPKPKKSEMKPKEGSK